MMSFSSEILEQAREALIETASQRLTLIGAIKEQGRKIAELEREVQKQMTGRVQAEAMCSELKREVETLRSMIPDDATVSAFEALTDYLKAPADSHPELRIAA
jgi:chromosome segregation ATPase